MDYADKLDMMDDDCDIQGYPIDDCEPITTNADHIRAMSDEALAEDGVHGYIPAGCATPAWYGHFNGFAEAKEEAIQREMDWLRQPWEEET